MLRLGVVVALEVPDHRIRVEVAAVVKLDALPQMKDPLRRIRLVLGPALGQPGSQRGQHVRAREIEEDQPLEDRKAEEAHALVAVVRHPGRRGDVGRRHGDAQGAAGVRRRNAPGEPGHGEERCGRDDRGELHPSTSHDET